MRLRDILEENVPLDYYLTQEFCDKIVIKRKVSSITGELGYIEKGTGQHQSSTIYDWNYLARTIQAGDYKAPLKIICTPRQGAGIIKVDNEWYSVRKLTTLECWRLQGFTDEDYYKANSLLSKTKMYERAGRGICVPMLEEIFKQYIDFETDKPLKVFEAFAGVGSQRMALRNLGADYEHVGIMEVDKYATLAYDIIHNDNQDIDYTENLTKETMLKRLRQINIAYNFSTYKDEMPSNINEIRKLYNAVIRSHNYGDISKVNPKNLPDFDFFTYSFPCKNISVAGNQKGLKRGSGTQSSLVWECEKIIREKKPKYLMMENVKNICGNNHMAFFQEWIDLLSEMGYESHWEIYNACDYGVPQNRERVIMMSKLKEK